ncbi:MAG TPA: Gfo/Idh/MocA family oxidoreductase [Prolixibacteraceae bacterium]|nr:Gfo/Idh/MocA family oxidoreductase [Prolixibacteraceae bacterium]
MERRNFIKNASIGSAALVSAFSIPAFSQERKLKIGLIGAGWYGMVIATAALKNGGVEVIAVCDVDSDHLNSSADELAKLQGTRPKTYKHYQELLDINGLEAVFIGTPPHWHALQFIAACAKGLDIYCEKPLAYDIKEGLAMVNAAQKAGNVVQIGFQRRQSDAFKKAKELIADGTIGNVHQITAQIHYVPGPQDTKIQPPPASLDWEEWCGPAPKLDYRPNIGHKAWRLEKEYGNGHLVDWGIHHIDIIRKIMGESMPSEFYTKGGIFELKNQITTPDTLTANMAFNKAPVVWQHRLWGTGDPNKEFNNGIFFHGDKATLFAEDSKVVLFHAGKDGKREELLIPTELMQEKHVANFLNAVKNKNKSLIDCPPEDAFQSTATVQLAMISYYTGSLVKWDPAKNEIVDNKAASALLKRDYRGKYKHP